MDFKLVLPNIYINIDIQTKFEVYQTQIGHSIPKKLQKLTKVVISQNPILPKCHSPKSLLLLHFSMNLSETFSPAFVGFWAQNFFGGLIQKSAIISMCKIHIYIDSKKFQTNSLKNVGGVGFLVNDTWAKLGFEIWPLSFWSFFRKNGQFGSD